MYKMIDLSISCTSLYNYDSVVKMYYTLRSAFNSHITNVEVVAPDLFIHGYHNDTLGRANAAAALNHQLKIILNIYYK